MQNVVRLSEFHAIAAAPELSIVVPCYNERACVAALVDRLTTALRGLRWEVIFVDDDSPDGTSVEVKRLALQDPRVRGLRRLGRRGLSSACIEGVLSSSAPFVAVMDGDLQHDETILPQMLAAVRNNSADIAVGSRYVASGTAAHGFNRRRQRMSDLGGRISQFFLTQPIADPMSGFFLLPREKFDEIAGNLSSDGFKILLDIMLSSPRLLRVAEVPFSFRPREYGESKLNPRVVVDFGILLLDKILGGVVPARFLVFTAIGSLGLLVHLAILWTCSIALGLSFVASQLIATYTAMVGNFVLNNAITYGYRAERGVQLFQALILWVCVCSVGVIGNVGVARVLYEDHIGLSLSAIAGAIITAVWNYVVSARVVWHRK